MAPIPNPFARKQPQGGGGKEGSPPGGGPPAVEPSAVPAAAETLEKQLTPLQIAQNEADTVFSPFMDDLEKQQNPEEPFFIRFGWNKGEKDPKSTFAQDKGAWADSRVLLLISPNKDNQFILITRWGPKKIEPQGRMSREDVKNLIEHILSHGKSSLVGGFGLNELGKPQVAIGYNPNPDSTSRTDAVNMLFADGELVEPSPQEVLDRIQASKELAHAKAEEKQTPLREARERLRNRKEMLEALLHPGTPNPEGPAAPPPPAPTA